MLKNSSGSFGEILDALQKLELGRLTRNRNKRSTQSETKSKHDKDEDYYKHLGLKVRRGNHTLQVKIEGK